MRRAVSVALLSLVGLVALPARGAEDDQTPCVRYWGESRYAAGYDHVVHIWNSCSVEASCTFHTDVNPTPELVSVAPGEHREITTWRGSPWATFHIFMECTLAKS